MARGDELVLAVDLGGSKVRAALARPEGKVLAELVEATVHGRAEAYVAQVVRLRDALCTAAGLDPAGIVAAGVGVPVAIDPATGLFGSTQNVPGLSGEAFAPAIREALGVEVRIENDADLAAVGEGWQGAAVGAADFTVVAVGTGIGAGVVTDGRLLHGAHGWAGELAYLPLGGDPFDPGVRRKGALEAAAAGPALRERIDAAARSGRPTSLVEGALLEDVLAAASAGDEVACRLLEEEARLLALGIAALAAVVDPALVVLSGGVGAVEGLAEAVSAWVARLVPRPPDVRRGHLGERAALVGAIALAAGRVGRSRD